MTTWDEYIREWIDITQREIDRREKTIAVYEALLVRLRAEREASRKHRLKDRAPRPRIR